MNEEEIKVKLDNLIAKKSKCYIDAAKLSDEISSFVIANYNLNSYIDKVIYYENLNTYIKVKSVKVTNTDTVLDISSINIVLCGDSLYTNYSSDYFEHKNNDFLIINLKKLSKMKILSEEEITSMKKKFVDIILKF